MASSSYREQMSASGLPGDSAISFDHSYTNSGAIPKLEYQDVPNGSYLAVTVANGNLRLRVTGPAGNTEPIYAACVNTATYNTEAVRLHPTEPTVLCLPAGGDIIYFQAASAISGVKFEQF